MNRTKQTPEFTRAVSRLTCTDVFFTSLLYTLKLIPDAKAVEGCTGGVGFTDGTRLVYHPERFAKTLNDKSRMWLVVHELLHVILMHPMRRGIRDPWRWNVACIDADSHVLLANGETCCAAEVAVGDWVSTPFGEVPVQAAKHSVRDEVMELDFHNGYTLTCTPDHKILTEAGYVAAEDIETGTGCCVDTRNERLFNREHTEEVPEGYCGGFRGEGQRGVFSDGATGIVEEPPHDQTAKSETDARVEFRAGSIFSGADRRGGVSILSRIAGQEWEAICCSCDNSNQHIVRSGAVAGNFRPVRDRREEQSRQFVLEVFGVRIPMQGLDSSYPPVCQDTCAAVRHSHRNHNTATSTGFTRPADTIHHELVVGIEGFEYARLTVSRRIKEKRVVVDLTTPTQCFIADGVVVHNCDHVVNLLCGEYGFEVPKDRLQDPQYKGMTAEQAYDLLPQDEQGDGEQDVQDYDPTDNDDKTQAGAEREIAINTATALQAAKVAGTDSAAMRRLVGEAQVQREPWYQHLRWYMTSMHSRAYNWAKVDARRAVLHGIVSPMQRTETMGKIVFAVDESGSITEKQLAAMGGAHQ